MALGATGDCPSLSFVSEAATAFDHILTSFRRLFLQEHRVVHDTVLGRLINWIFDDDASDVALVLVLQQLLGANCLRVMDALSL